MIKKKKKKRNLLGDLTHKQGKKGNPEWRKMKKGTLTFPDAAGTVVQKNTSRDIMFEVLETCYILIHFKKFYLWQQLTQKGIPVFFFISLNSHFECDHTIFINKRNC